MVMIHCRSLPSSAMHRESLIIESTSLSIRESHHPGRRDEVYDIRRRKTGGAGGSGGVPRYHAPVTRRWMWIDAMTAGAAAGLVAEALVLRMNPEVTQEMRGVILGMPLWASWGMLMLGVPLLIGLAVLQRIRRHEDRWLAPELTAVVFVLASILSAVNAKFHVHLLQGSAHRVLVQDAVAWSLAALLALAGGWAVRRAGGSDKLRLVFVVFVLVLPVLRVVGVPTPPRQFLEVSARPLGTPTRPLLVIGMEGLDSKFLLTDAIGANLPTLARLREDGSRVRIQPHRPYLRWALWTSVATGTYPGQHGVKAHWGWELPIIFPKTLRLLPWTPEGSRMILPWGLATRVQPPPSTVAPLWARLAASDVATAVFGWPGSWGEDPSFERAPDFDRDVSIEPSMNASLDAALEPFPERRSEIWEAIVRDQARVDSARDAIVAGDRRRLDPPRDPRPRPPLPRALAPPSHAGAPVDGARDGVGRPATRSSSSTPRPRLPTRSSPWCRPTVLPLPVPSSA